jgi:hypothetical protein
MAKTAGEARRALNAAVKRLGGPRRVSAICDVSEWAVKLWLKTGNLNQAKALNAQKFARASGASIEDFLVISED